ncbi:hypothetical protein GOP47_0005115 [Adiantum capillus-veneris]|uniref:U-box domain-containing protein n=1 Tax=Adiantum capillus-veneris TaxID=13818 RepID=A0A9D4V4I8_ADICA|nr:hypothetical protein GOP47_0005115 [Adiantum capillus-veneris]
MCILCIASRWSRHIAAMVMPMVTLWALSQFLPQGFRFEINSPKLACVGVLFVSLSWFELVMPRLSAWRARRISAQKERKRVEAQEAAKRRKKATRRCRNCYTAYKDQTPASGRFMCTFCGHISKRPVLDLPVGAASARSSFSLSESAVEFLSGSGFFSVSVSPKYWYDRASFVRPSWGSGRSWIGVGPWIDGASWGMSTLWFGGSWPSSALYFGNTGFGWPGSGGNLLGDGVFGGERWFAGDSYSGVVCFVVRAFSQLLVFTVWIWRKLSRTEYVEENGIDGEHEDFHPGDVVGASSFEAKDRKARRKAEEKRLARVERERQEAEEKNQREEVATLVEERRRQRVKKLQLNETIDTSSRKEIEVERKRERRQEKFQDMENINGRDTEELTRKTSFPAAKVTKPSRNTGVKDKEANVKAPSTFFSKWSKFKSQVPAKSRLFAHSRNVAVSTKSAAPLLTDVACPPKPCKNSVLGGTGSSPSISSWNTKLSEPCGTASGSAWTDTPWAKVLSRGALDSPVDTLEDTGIIQSPHKQENSNKNVGSMSSSLDKSVSNLMGDISQTQFETSASTFGNIQNFGGECSQPACQFTESTIFNFESDDHMNANTDPSSLCNRRSSILEPMQYSVSSTYSGPSEMVNTDSLPRVAGPSLLSDFAGKQADNPIFVRPTGSSAVMMHESGKNALQPLIEECLPLSESMNRCNSCQIWEPWSISVNNSGGLLPQEKWHPGIYPSQMNTLPVDTSLQQRDDFYQQTTFNPEFYLPSSLFSVEESEIRECCCEDRLPRPPISAWEDLDVHYKIPPEFVDCITHSLMQDPVITADGHSYERSAIEDWLKSHDTSPKTGEVLPPPPGGEGVDKTLRPNHILRCQIIEFRERLLQRYGTRAGLMTPSHGPESDGLNSFPGHSLSNNLLPVQAVWSHDVFGE